MVKQASLFCFVLGLAVTLSGCCTAEKCRAEFGLTECTEAECAETHPPPAPPQGPDGPDVDLGHGGGNVLIWKVNGADATSGGSILDPANTTTYCKLREDFIGKRILHYRYTRLAEVTPRVAEEIALESGDIQLRIKRGSSGAMDWWIKNKNTGRSCTLKGGEAPSTITEVPSEFIGLTYGQAGDVFREVVEASDAKEMALKVKY